MGMQMRQQPCPNCRAVLVYDAKDGRAAETVTCPYCGWTKPEEPKKMSKE